MKLKFNIINLLIKKLSQSILVLLLVIILVSILTLILREKLYSLLINCT